MNEQYKKVSQALMGNHNRSKPFGSTRTDKNGYLEIKVYAKDYTTAHYSHRGATKEGGVWIPMQQKVWIDNNGDNIPPKHKVIFLDGNKYNFEPDNLMLVSSCQNGLMNLYYRYTADKELNKVKITLSELKHQIRRKKLEKDT